MRATPAWWSRLMAASRSTAITVGPWPRWIRLASSPKVTSLADAAVLDRPVPAFQRQQPRRDGQRRAAGW